MTAPSGSGDTWVRSCRDCSTVSRFVSFITMTPSRSAFPRRPARALIWWALSSPLM